MYKLKLSSTFISSVNCFLLDPVQTWSFRDEHREEELDQLCKIATTNSKSSAPSYKFCIKCDAWSRRIKSRFVATSLFQPVCCSSHLPTFSSWLNKLFTLHLWKKTLCLLTVNMSNIKIIVNSDRYRPFLCRRGDKILQFLQLKRNFRNCLPLWCLFTRRTDGLAQLPTSDRITQHGL